MSVLLAAEPLAEDGEQAQRERQRAVNEVLAEAGEVGRVVAGWVRSLAARQAEGRHCAVLERAADAIERAAGREVVPGGDGQLAEELAYDLAAGVVTGSPYAQALPDLVMGERIALVATMDAAVTAGQTVPYR
ncbi:hypothetical protein ACIG0C_30955 [Kitasatospora aureofaciens]|uniref:Uncharacterized protein n=1 Tax=Kitasatospora aureofaciens TaxID=1894 RepID=A0A1E7N9H4_KITAU|nr:hypothetical protein [Kitasatospora aureofaciens]OEV37345.1 hypothetical protein HS99_0006050 [Kitasatospora aureofaciens]GGV00641.1 hypothetical protein GCM10010502_63940 [Kitasatospora aureofaciens]